MAYGTILTATQHRPDKGQKPIEIVLCPPMDEEAAAQNGFNWANDPFVKLFLSMSNSFSLSGERDYVKNCGTDDGLHWCINIDGVHIGGCGLHRISLADRRAEIGLMIGEKDYWGKGIAQAVEAMITDYALSNVVASGLHKIYARVFVNDDGSGNEASRAAIMKVGYKTVGVFRKHQWLYGRWYDEWNGEILQEEWQKIRREVMKKVGIKKLDPYRGCESKGFIPEIFS